MMQTTATSPEETRDLGRLFAGSLRPGDIVALTGTLGTGKTRFVQGICEGLGVHAHVGSPTFTLINEYPAPFGTVVHIDLYRIRSASELTELGIQEYFNDTCICLIEWPEIIAGVLPPDCYRITIKHGAKDLEREITVEKGGA